MFWFSLMVNLNLRCCRKLFVFISNINSVFKSSIAAKSEVGSFPALITEPFDNLKISYPF